MNTDSKTMNKRCTVWLSVFLMALPYAGFTQTHDTMSGVLDWTNMYINTQVRLDLRGMGINLPAGRTIAEERLFSAYFSNIKPFIHSILVDSSSVLGDFVDAGQLTPEAIDGLAARATMIPPSLSLDMRSITALYRINLSEVCSALIHHSRGADFLYLIDTQSAPAYTGIIIVAQEELPVHGRKSKAKLVPCLFPKVWDTDMNLIYDKKFTNPELFQDATMVNYMGSDHIFRRTPSGLSPEIEKIVGEKPLRIIARGVFGIHPTDPVIDKSDAMVILAREENKRLLREGRVVVITSDSVLETNFRRQPADGAPPFTGY